METSHFSSQNSPIRDALFASLALCQLVLKKLTGTQWLEKVKTDIWYTISFLFHNSSEVFLLLLKGARSALVPLVSGARSFLAPEEKGTRSWKRCSKERAPNAL